MEEINNISLFMINNLISLIKKKRNIKLIAIDFDKTIISLHTWGRWDRSMEELLPYVRPFFKNLFLSLFKWNEENKNEKIYFSIVTFSGQMKLIKNILDTTLNKSEIENNNNIKYNIDIIKMRGATKKWNIPKGSSLNGKQPHINSIIEEIYIKENDIITLKDVLLIDDDINNINYATKENVHAFYFNPDLHDCEQKLYDKMMNYFS